MRCAAPARVKYGERAPGGLRNARAYLLVQPFQALRRSTHGQNRALCKPGPGSTTCRLSKISRRSFAVAVKKSSLSSLAVAASMVGIDRRGCGSSPKRLPSAYGAGAPKPGGGAAVACSSGWLRIQRRPSGRSRDSHGDPQRRDGIARKPLRDSDPRGRPRLRACAAPAPCKGVPLRRYGSADAHKDR